MNIPRIVKLSANSGCLVVLVACSAMALNGQTASLKLRLAGDKWFLNTLTNPGLIRTFEQKNGMQVEIVYRDDPKIVADLEQGAGPNRAPYDIVVVRHRFIGELVGKGRLLEIDSPRVDPHLDAKQALFTNWWRELSSYKGAVYGYPYACLTTFLCYRKDLLQDGTNRRNFQARYGRELKVPTTWPEYLQIAQFFTRPNENFYGTYIQGRNHIALWYEWLNFVYSYGGNILDSRHGWDYGDIVVNSPQNIAATQQYLALLPFSPPDTLRFNWNEALSELQQGRVFMGLLWNDQAPLLENASVSKVAGKIGYALIPSNSGKPFSQLEGLTYLIPKESKHPHETRQFLEWAISPDIQVTQTLNGGASALKQTYSDARVKALPYTNAFLSSVPVAIPKPTVPETTHMIEIMQEGLAAIVSGRRSPQEGLDSVALELHDILGDKARLRYRPARPQ